MNITQILDSDGKDLPIFKFMPEKGDSQTFLHMLFKKFNGCIIKDKSPEYIAVHFPIEGKFYKAAKENKILELLKTTFPEEDLR